MDAVVSARMSNGHNFNADPSLNAAGLVYTTFVTAYTGVLLYSMLMLWLHRHHPAVRIRGFYVTCAAIVSLHVYVAALFIVYPLNGWYKCGSEFWYMSIIFPFGIAMFQAANVKLMAVSREQQAISELDACWAEKKKPFRLSRTGFKDWLDQQDFLKKTYVLIVGGMFLQVFFFSIISQRH